MLIQITKIKLFISGPFRKNKKNKNCDIKKKTIDLSIICQNISFKLFSYLKLKELNNE